MIPFLLFKERQNESAVVGRRSVVWAAEGALLGEGKVLHLECGGDSPEVHNIEAHQIKHFTWVYFIVKKLYPSTSVHTSSTERARSCTHRLALDSFMGIKA